VSVETFKSVDPIAPIPEGVETVTAATLRTHITALVDLWHDQTIAENNMNPHPAARNSTVLSYIANFKNTSLKAGRAAYIDRGNSK
jgi:hypothetical protein